jgi:hypothetical protein
MADGLPLGPLERDLAALAAELAWPPTPKLGRRVRTRIERRFRPGLGVLLVAAAIAAAFGTQAAVGGLIQIRGATIQSVATLPSPSALPPGDVGARHSLGIRYGSIQEAAAAAGFQPLVPAALGAPDEIYWRPSPGVVTLVYRPRADLPASSADPQVGALLMEAQGTVNQAAFGKLAGPGTTVQAVRVGGATGFWISGAPHGFLIYQGPHGEFSADTLRLSGDALIWNQGPLVVRLESGLGRDGSIRAGESLR